MFENIEQEKKKGKINMTVKNSAVVPLFPEDENITPFPCNVPNFLGLDYDRLAEAILRKTKEEENKKRAAAQKSAAEKRKIMVLS